MKGRILILMVAMFLATSCAWSAEEKAAHSSNAKVRHVDLTEFDKLRADKRNAVLDVRSEKEFKAGHIPGAINIDIADPAFDAKVAKLDRSKTYMVHCVIGHRSAKACDRLYASGFTNILDFTPGLRAWEKAGKPVEK
jgi:phage shock protein E